MAMDSIRNEREQQSGLALKVPAHGRASKYSEVELRDAGSLTQPMSSFPAQPHTAAGTLQHQAAAIQDEEVSKNMLNLDSCSSLSSNA